MFTGREYDSESGLYHYRTRVYHPILGRFMQRDPIGPIDSLNLFEYVGSNPVNKVDPSGRTSGNCLCASPGCGCVQFICSSYGRCYTRSVCVCGCGSSECKWYCHDWPIAADDLLNADHHSLEVAQGFTKATPANFLLISGAHSLPKSVDVEVYCEDDCACLDKECGRLYCAPISAGWDFTKRARGSSLLIERSISIMQPQTRGMRKEPKRLARKLVYATAVDNNSGCPWDCACLDRECGDSDCPPLIAASAVAAQSFTKAIPGSALRIKGNTSIRQRHRAAPSRKRTSSSDC